MQNFFQEQVHYWGPNARPHDVDDGGEGGGDEGGGHGGSGVEAQELAKVTKRSQYHLRHGGSVAKWMTDELV